MLALFARFESAKLPAGLYEDFSSTTAPDTRLPYWVIKKKGFCEDKVEQN